MTVEELKAKLAAEGRTKPSVEELQAFWDALVIRKRLEIERMRGRG